MHCVSYILILMIIHDNPIKWINPIHINNFEHLTLQCHDHPIPFPLLRTVLNNVFFCVLLISPSGRHKHGTSPFLMAKLTISMAIFHGSVKLPEGNSPFSYGFPMVFPYSPMFNGNFQ